MDLVKYSAHLDRTLRIFPGPNLRLDVTCHFLYTLFDKDTVDRFLKLL